MTAIRMHRPHDHLLEDTFYPTQYADSDGGDGGGDGGGDADADGKGGDGKSADGKGDDGKGGDGPDYEFDLSQALADSNSRKTITSWAEREVAKPLKSKLDKALGKLVRYKIENKETGEEEYIDPDEAKAAIEQIRSGKTPDVQDEVNRAVKAASDRYDAIVESVRNENDSLKGQFAGEVGRRHRMMVEYALSGALIDSGIKAGKRHLHELYLTKYLSVSEEDNEKEVVVVVDDDGKPRYGSKGLMSIPEFINEYKNRDGVAEDWNPSIGGGSGTGPSVGGRRGAAIDQSLSPTERMRILRRTQG